MDKINWKPIESGLNLAASSLEPGHYDTFNPESGWVLYSRGGFLGCWTQRTKREFPPAPGLIPTRINGEWFWAPEPPKPKISL